MKIIQSILLTVLFNHFGIVTGNKGRDVQADVKVANTIHRNLKKSAKIGEATDVVVAKDSKNAARLSKAGKASEPPTSSPSETQIGEDEDVPATSFPSPWPTYYPVEAESELPTYTDIGLDADIVVGIRTPNCPRFMGESTTPRPITMDTVEPTKLPTSKPSNRPSKNPSNRPTQRPSSLPGITFERGALKKDIKRFGFKVSKGMTVRKIAQADKYVRFANGKRSETKYHAMPDGAAVIPLSDGYVYVNNAEIKDGLGGVYGLYFDRHGRMVDYRVLLSGTSRSCAGGKTPWNTYVSCEEVQDGQCWQVDPDPSSQYHTRPEAITFIGRGYFEAIAIDNRDPSVPVMYIVEDIKFGALRKYTPPPKDNGAIADWTSLHTPGGTTEFLLFLNENTFTWTTCDEDAARLSQATSFPYPEGIDVKDGILYFVSKKTYKLYMLNLDQGSYTTLWTNNTLAGDGEFSNSPDQIVRNEGDFLYFTEDGGSTPGVYMLDQSNEMRAIFEAYDPIYKGDETTGIAFSPTGNIMYANFQDCGCEVTYANDCGCLFQFTRDDGLSYDAESK